MCGCKAKQKKEHMPTFCEPGPCHKDCRAALHRDYIPSLLLALLTSDERLPHEFARASAKSCEGASPMDQPPNRESHQLALTVKEAPPKNAVRYSHKEPPPPLENPRPSKPLEGGPLTSPKPYAPLQPPHGQVSQVSALVTPP
jgi:hypothetical protein